MADVDSLIELASDGSQRPARTEMRVTTGPIRGSRKIHVGPLKVAMREIDLEPGSGEPPVRVYDTSGPYTDPNARIDALCPARHHYAGDGICR